MGTRLVMLKTFATRMREQGFNSREIRYYRQRLYRSHIKCIDVCDVRIEDNKYVNIYFDLWNQVVSYTLIHK